MDDLVRTVAKKAHKPGKRHKSKQKVGSVRPAGANSKAFTFSGGRRAVHRRFQHASEVAERRLRPPRVLKSPLEPPPLVVVVQGPKSAGKSTLVASLVKHFSKRNVSTVAGPITLVASKSRRVTLIECGNSLIDMIDCAKIADVALVLIDASYGFEMETFEFVNMLQVHGFPRIVGILTHLDAFKDNKTLRKTRKTLKKRFWAEIYDGAKMFYFNGTQYDRYRKQEVLNLARFIASLKPPIISWRLSHPYSVCLRHEVSDSKASNASSNAPTHSNHHSSDSTDYSKHPNESPADSHNDSNPSLNRHSNSNHQNYATVSFYGYVYGGKFNVSNKIHIPGFGDFAISSISNFQDPCQINTQERTLKDKNRNIYAPYCDVGSLMLDDDAMYIQLFKTKEHFTEMPDEDKANISDAVQMVRTLQKIDQFKKSEMELSILNGSKKVNEESTDSSSVNEDGLGDDANLEDFDDSGSTLEWDPDSEDGDEEDEDEGDGDDQDLSDEEEDGNQGESESESDDNDDGSATKEVDGGEEAVYSADEYADEESCPDSSDDSEDSDDSEGEEEDGEDDEQPVGAGHGVEIYDEISQRVYFADSAPNTGLRDFARVSDHDLGVSWDEGKLRLLRDSKFVNLADENEEQEPEFENDPESEKFRSIQEEEQKRLFQETVELDATGNVGHFVKITVCGFPSELTAGLGARPIIIGSIQPSEQGCGFIQLKLKRHRWSPKILKTNDPLLFSVGWRRFQSLPVYCMEDRNQSRVKMLKYTPEHLHCLANIYGPLSPPNFGILAIKNWDRVPNYRISASGVTVGTNQSYRILKKLKLIGEPYKIMKNTCFIKNMFNSELEVIKCIGSKIQTASGIRGQIKKPIDKNGAFRATFEDKLLLSDLVVLKSWINVETKQFYNLLVDSGGFKRVKSISELKKVDDVRPDSKYERKQLLRRPARHFNEIRIPKPIIEKLPFSSKPKVVETPKEHELRFDASEHEKKLARMLHKLHTIRKHRLEKRNESMKEYKSKKALELEKLQLARDAKLREIRKRKYIKGSKAEESKRAKLLL